MPGRIDLWKIDEVRTYLRKHFGGARVDDAPRGAWAAHLFTVTEPGPAPGKQKRYSLLLTRQFFDRLSDHSAFVEALNAADVARTLARAGERTVELY